MIHLKTYKENTEKRYTSLDHVQYIIRISKLSEKLTKKEIESIKKCLTNYNPDVNFKNYNQDNILKINFTHNENIIVDLYVKKFPDEWYTIRVGIVEKVGMRTSNHRYLCDQFSGLIECINDSVKEIFNKQYL